MMNEVNRENMRRIYRMSLKKDSYIDDERLQLVLDMINRTAEMGESYISIVNSFSEPNLRGLMDELRNRGFTVRIVPNRLEILWD